MYTKLLRKSLKIERESNMKKCMKCGGKAQKGKVVKKKTTPSKKKVAPKPKTDYTKGFVPYVK